LREKRGDMNAPNLAQADGIYKAIWCLEVVHEEALWGLRYCFNGKYQRVAAVGSDGHWVLYDVSDPDHILAEGDCVGGVVAARALVEMRAYANVWRFLEVTT